MKKQIKKTRTTVRVRCVGVFLSSRAVASQVLSAQVSLTTVFGMGTGVPSPPSTPTIAPPVGGTGLTLPHGQRNVKNFFQIFLIFLKKPKKPRFFKGFCRIYATGEAVVGLVGAAVVR